MKRSLLFALIGLFSLAVVQIACDDEDENPEDKLTESQFAAQFCDKFKECPTLLEGEAYPGDDACAEYVLNFMLCESFDESLAADCADELDSMSCEEFSDESTGELECDALICGG